MSDEPRTPDLDTLLSLLAQSLKAELRVSLPGKITAYDKDKQEASVKALVRDAHVAPDDKRVSVGIPEIHGVPVLHPGPPRGRITFPVKVGDLCLIQFCSSSITQWLLKGGEVDPRNDRHHDINDAVALVGLHSFSSIPTTAPDDAVVVHAGLGIKIKLGGPSGTEPTIMADTYRPAEDTMLSSLSALAAALSTFAGFCTGPTAPQLTALTDAAAAAIAAISTFTGAAAAYKTTTTEVK